jgi:hypothetical protein
MSPGDLLVPVALGVVGSLHCVQMCGPVVLACSVAMETRSTARRLLAQLAYNAGRILTYGALGAAAGGAGTGLNLIGSLAGLRNTAAVAAGTLLLAGGALVLAGRRLRFPRAWSVPAGLGQRLRSGSLRSRFALGVALGFLPCGLVYAALLKSLESAGPAAGALTMAAFGAGTAAPLLAVGTFAAVIGRRFGRHAALVSSLAVMATGMLLVWRGLRSPAACCH